MTTTIPSWLPDPVKTCIRSGSHLVEFDQQNGECAACGYSESAEWDFRTDQQGPIAGSELPVDTNGWSREDVFVSVTPESDDAIGPSYCARYRKGNRSLDLCYYVVGHHQNYDVELMAHSFAVSDDGEFLDDSSDEYDYSHPFDFGFTEFEAALRAARNGAMADERFKLG